jgi:hypothetical protein
MVTADTRSVVLFIDTESPSVVFVSGCKCGISLSRASRKKTPAINPIAAGTQPIKPFASDISIAGMSKPNTDAEIIIPAAKPRNTVCIFLLAPFLKKNTTEDPKDVIKKIKPVPIAAHIKAFIYFTPHYFLRKTPLFVFLKLSIITTYFVNHVPAS